MHKSSHSNAKNKPKVRVVHLQTPEVIEIEPADFQKFAQSLTGNSTAIISKHNKTKSSSKDEPIILCDESSNTEMETFPKDNFNPSHTFATCRKKGNISRKTNLSLAMHKGSHSIGNMKQQVRIAHIPKPEAKEIEPADFQKVVQSLTGKSSAIKNKIKKPEDSSKKVPIILCDEPSSKAEIDILNEFRSCLGYGDKKDMTSWENLSDEPIIGFEASSSTETDILNEFHSCLEYRNEKTTDEEEMNSWENFSDESIIGFEDLDKFINELIDVDYSLFDKNTNYLSV